MFYNSEAIIIDDPEHSETTASVSILGLRSCIHSIYYPQWYSASKDRLLMTYPPDLTDVQWALSKRHFNAGGQRKGPHPACRRVGAWPPFIISRPGNHIVLMPMASLTGFLFALELDMRYK